MVPADEPENELTDEPENKPLDEPEDGPMGEPAEFKGRLAQEHLPTDELAEEYPPDSEHTGTLPSECPASW